MPQCQVPGARRCGASSRYRAMGAPLFYASPGSRRGAGFRIRKPLPRLSARPAPWAPTPNPACWLDVTDRLLRSRACVHGCRVLWLPSVGRVIAVDLISTIRRNRGGVLKTAAYVELKSRGGDAGPVRCPIAPRRGTHGQPGNSNGARLAYDVLHGEGMHGASG